MTVKYDQERGIYYDAAHPETLELDHYWTLFCGGHGEEIDVAARTQAQARQVGRAAIASDYEPIDIDSVERRYCGITYF